MDNVEKNYEKVVKVINSCVSTEQLDTAIKYCDLFLDKYIISETKALILAQTIKKKRDNLIPSDFFDTQYI